MGYVFIFFPVLFFGLSSAPFHKAARLTLHLSRAALTRCLSVHHDATNRYTPFQSVRAHPPTVAPPPTTPTTPTFPHPSRFLPFLVTLPCGVAQVRQTSTTPSHHSRCGRLVASKGQPETHCGGAVSLSGSSGFAGFCDPVSQSLSGSGRAGQREQT